MPNPDPQTTADAIHMAHCYQGEYEDTCKYGDDDCPAAPKSKTTDPRPNHWLKVELPEDNGDPRLLDACWALMDVCAKPPAGEHYIHDLPVLDLDPDLNDLPIDHTQGTADDPITQVAVVRLAKAVLAIADRFEGCKKS